MENSRSKIIDLLETSPVIAAIKNEEGLSHLYGSECSVVFILYGNICNIAGIVNQVKNYGMTAIVHVDFIAGLSPKEIAVDFIKQSTRADGIISTKPLLVKRAQELGMIAGQRSFLIDSIAFETLRRQIYTFQPDFVEIMPGIMPNVLKMTKEYTQIPIVAGGMIFEKKDVMAAFDAGADAISTSKEELWFI